MMKNSDRSGLIRTHLANERTLLSYIRTSLAFLAGGVGMIHLFPEPVLRLFGWIALGMGFAVLGIGVYRFIAAAKRISGLDDRP